MSSSVDIVLCGFFPPRKHVIFVSCILHWTYNMHTVIISFNILVHAITIHLIPYNRYNLFKTNFVTIDFMFTLSTFKRCFLGFTSLSLSLCIIQFLYFQWYKTFDNKIFVFDSEIKVHESKVSYDWLNQFWHMNMIVRVSSNKS